MSAAYQFPLPRGETVGVRCRSGEKPASRSALLQFPASPAPSHRSSPQGGEEAKANA
jgi:hypothetical protein